MPKVKRQNLKLLRTTSRVIEDRVGDVNKKLTEKVDI